MVNRVQATVAPLKSEDRFGRVSRMVAICVLPPSRVAAPHDRNPQLAMFRPADQSTINARSGRNFAVPGRCWKAGVLHSPAVCTSKMIGVIMLASALNRL
jgi:hypothetical protein